MVWTADQPIVRLKDVHKAFNALSVLKGISLDVMKGEVPPYAVVVPGTLGGGDGKPGLYCAVIVKRVDAQTRSKTSINELLRD